MCCTQYQRSELRPVNGLDLSKDLCIDPRVHIGMDMCIDVCMNVFMDGCTSTYTDMHEMDKDGDGDLSASEIRKGILHHLGVWPMALPRTWSPVSLRACLLAWRRAWFLAPPLVRSIARPVARLAVAGSMADSMARHIICCSLWRPITFSLL